VLYVIIMGEEIFGNKNQSLLRITHVFSNESIRTWDVDIVLSSLTIIRKVDAELFPSFL